MKKPKIRIPMDEAQIKIKIQLRRGETISKFPITDLNYLMAVEEKRSEWYNDTKNLLEEIDENSVLVNDFHYLTPTVVVGVKSTQDRVNDFRHQMKKDVSKLQSILNMVRKSKCHCFQVAEYLSEKIVCINLEQSSYALQFSLWLDRDQALYGRKFWLQET